MLRLATLFRGHAAVAGGGAGPRDGRATAQCFLGVGRQRAEAHAGNGYRDFQIQRLLGKTIAEHHVGAALLAVAFQRVARHAGTEQQQVVEVRQLALGAATANVVDAGFRSTLDFLNGQAIESGRLAQDWSRFVADRVAHGNAPGSVRGGVIDFEVVQLTGRAVAFEIRCLLVEARAIEQLLQLLQMLFTHLLGDAVRAQ